MNVTRRREYTVPVHSFEEPKHGQIRNPEQPESDDTERIVVVLYESQTGSARLTAYHHHDDERTHYNFRVTNADEQWCAYKGDEGESVPVHVLHAVHHFGYGVENIETLGRWVPIWMEIHSGYEILRNISQDSDDQLTRRTADMAAKTYEVIDSFLRLKYELNEERYEGLWNDVSELTDDGSVKVVELRTQLFDVFRRIDTPSLSSEQSETLWMFAETNLYKKDGNDLLAVDLITEFGVKRFPFEVQDNDTCVFLSGQVSFPSPVAIEKVVEHGFMVKNVESIRTATDRIDALGRTIAQLTELEGIPPIEITDGESHPFMISRIHTISRMVFLLQLLLAREADEDAYEATTQHVTEHLGVSDLSSVPAETVGEIVQAVIRLLPDAANDHVGQRLQDNIPENLIDEVY